MKIALLVLTIFLVGVHFGVFVKNGYAMARRAAIVMIVLFWLSGVLTGTLLPW